MDVVGYVYCVLLVHFLKSRAPYRASSPGICTVDAHWHELIFARD